MMSYKNGDVEEYQSEIIPLDELSLLGVKKSGYLPVCVRALRIDGTINMYDNEVYANFYLVALFDEVDLVGKPRFDILAYANSTENIARLIGAMAAVTVDRHFTLPSNLKIDTYYPAGSADIDDEAHEDCVEGASPSISISDGMIRMVMRKGDKIINSLDASISSPSLAIGLSEVAKIQAWERKTLKTMHERIVEVAVPKP